MADVPVKISDLNKAYNLSDHSVDFLINQKNDNGNYETRSLPLSTLREYAKKEAAKILNTTSIEVGTIIPFAGKVLSQESIKGWLLCNGQQVRKKDYEALWNLIGEIYGPSTNDLFTLPDFKGRIEMGYSHIEDSYEPDFGNWLSGEKIHLGEGNNANYPDRGEFYHKLLESEIRDHKHFMGEHKHKVLNYANMTEFTLRGGPKNSFGGIRWVPYSYRVGEEWIVSPSVNYIELNILGPSVLEYQRLQIGDRHWGYGLIGHRNYDVIYKGREAYMKSNPYTQSLNGTRNPITINMAIRLIFCYNKEYNDEIKNRKKNPPVKNSAYDSNMKTLYHGKDSMIGGNNIHSNMQPSYSMNFLIKY